MSTASALHVLAEINLGTNICNLSLKILLIESVWTFATSAILLCPRTVASLCLLRIL